MSPVEVHRYINISMAVSEQLCIEKLCHYCIDAEALVLQDRMMNDRPDSTNAMTGDGNSYTRLPLGVQVKQLTKQLEHLTAPKSRILTYFIRGNIT